MRRIVIAAAATLLLAIAAQAQPTAPQTPTETPHKAAVENYAAAAGAQMTTCSNAAKAEAQANPGMPVSNAKEKNGQRDLCQNTNNGSADKTTDTSPEH